ncbi:hypothetical protein BDV37DRAFT_271126 [Aspergillus pseudonomiae]|uniref:Peptidase M20 domain-containing protein 2 n=1 Tax=Aspergillus pseudonomiae TaxID=1506151 RepID=A0A5N7DF65_9EURO|nr:uncharacterized protein BDV37DRAFT_271126 [Aspergillus pseudonomiae]KAE8404919.1 hypothetical protein BDV37DRAFT_271126 [Aspergillus pseudonomiae]
MASIAETINKHEERLWQVNQQIHSNPELGYEEVHAHDTLCNLLESLGYSVTRHAYGLKTSFEVEVGTGGGLIVYNAEFDALPEIGHACGHNLIATSSLAAFLATAEAINTNQIEGRVRLLGTPAEEGGGGKIELLKAGAYKGVDACLMGHPGPGVAVDGVAAARCMARGGATVTFRGVSAHAGNAPWLGHNALDAAVAAYSNMAMLRQQVAPNQRIHAIISKGGDKPNVIPHLTELQFFVRAETDMDLRDTVKRVTACCEGAAKAAGCTVDFDWLENYKELQCSNLLIETFYKHSQEQKQNYMKSLPTVSGASTDQGNVSYELPSLHPGFLIEVDSPTIGPHHPGFEKAAGTRQAFESCLRFASVMAATGLEVLQDEELRNRLWAEHRERFDKTE